MTLLVPEFRGRTWTCRQGAAPMALSLTGSGQPSAGEQKDKKAETDPFGFPVSCYSLTVQECEIEVDS